MGLREQLARFLGRSPSTTELSGLEANAATLQNRLDGVQQALCYSFRDTSLLHHALVHRSHAHMTGASRLQTNERLEFLGDAILGALVSDYLFRRFPEREEGDLTRMKARLVCGASLSRLASDLDLGDHIFMSSSEAATGGRERASILADTVEALLGAIYLDGGLESVRNVLSILLLQRADEILELEDLVNNKSKLQELIQARYKSPPRYRVLETTGPDHDRLYDVQVSVGDVVLGRGRGSSKKVAEQSAAKLALATLAENPKLLERDDIE